MLLLSINKVIKKPEATKITAENISSFKIFKQKQKN